MKNTLLTIKLLFLLFLTGCNNNDDLQDPIVGKWELVEFSIQGEPIELSNCDKRETLEITSNGKIVITKYENTNPDDADQCEVSSVINLSWSLNRTNTYLIWSGDESMSSQGKIFNIIAVDGFLKFQADKFLDGSMDDDIRKDWRYKEL